MRDSVIVQVVGEPLGNLISRLGETVVVVAPAGTPDADTMVALVRRPATAWLPAFISEALRVAREQGALAVVPVDGAGEELDDVWVGRADALSRASAPGRSGYVPLPVASTTVGSSRDSHQAEAEQYRDRIGDRLLRPADVEQDKRHLIQDDFQRVARILALPVHGPLLDVGCSDGTVLLEMVRRWNVDRALGIDVAESAVREARATAAADPVVAGRVTFRCGFIEDLADPDGSFRTVSACETLEHMAPGHLDAALASLLRVLAPGGDMLVTVPNRYPSDAYARAGRARWSWPAHHQFFSQTSLRALLAPHFESLRFLPLYDHDATDESIYLICHAERKRR